MYITYIDSMKIIVLQLNSKISQEEFIWQNFPDIFVLWTLNDI